MLGLSVFGGITVLFKIHNLALFDSISFSNFQQEDKSFFEGYHTGLIWLINSLTYLLIVITLLIQCFRCNRLSASKLHI